MFFFFWLFFVFGLFFLLFLCFWFGFLGFVRIFSARFLECLMLILTLGIQLHLVRSAVEVVSRGFGIPYKVELDV